MDRPLRGVRILAVEQYGAGPFGTQHLADLGAEVIKVENRRTGGDYARGLGPFFAGDPQASDASLYFQAFNRNKKSLSLDLSGDAGQAVLRRLAPHFDAVANNLRGDVPDKLGITYAALEAANPAIVCAHCSAFGRSGPRRDWPGYDFLMQAEAGYFAMSGEPDGPPARMGLSLVDYMGGTYLALALVSGVLAARSTGRGRRSDAGLARRQRPGRVDARRGFAVGRKPVGVEPRDGAESVGASSGLGPRADPGGPSSVIARPL